MSGCRKRLKSTSPEAPAFVSRAAMLAIALKYGATLTATGMPTCRVTDSTSST